MTLCSALLAGEASALNLSPTAATVPVGGSKTVLVSAASGEIQAESKNTAVVTVALSNRTSTGATLTLYGKAAGSATVYVRDAKTPNISLPVTVTKSMTVSPSSLSLAVGTTGKLTASGYSGTVSASSANTRIATVSVSSNVVTVKGVAAGSAVVSVKDSKVTVNVPVTVLTSTASSNWVYKVLATNDLGMHCVDADFSVFSILPPYNVVNAQVVRRATTGKPAVVNDSVVSIRYEAVRDAAGSINSSSLRSAAGPKTNFWTHAEAVYGAKLQPGQGLKGLYMPGDTTTVANKSLSWNATGGLFKAEGVPILPVDDAGIANRYPLMRLVATEKATGKDVAYLDVVLPVSEETTCSDCHDLGGTATQRTGITWSQASDKEIRTRENVLLLHDNMNNTTLMASKPVLCARCHYSPALDLGGTGPQGDQVGKATMSSAMHAYHSNKMQGYTDNWIRLGGTPNPDTQACYTCHPGRNTKCLRGAMTETVNCQNCHGDMKAVGGMAALKAGGSIDGANDGKPRRPWMDLPRCQSCHTGDAVNYLKLDPSLMASDGLRTIVAFDPSGCGRLATACEQQEVRREQQHSVPLQQGPWRHRLRRLPQQHARDLVESGRRAQRQRCGEGAAGTHRHGGRVLDLPRTRLARTHAQRPARHAQRRGLALDERSREPCGIERAGLRRLPRHELSRHRALEDRSIPHLEHRVRHAHRGQGPGRGLLRLPQRPESVSKR